jgi:hypothetical protein
MRGKKMHDQKESYFLAVAFTANFTASLENV